MLDIFVKGILYLSISIFALFSYSMPKPLSHARHDFVNLLTFNANLRHHLHVRCGFTPSLFLRRDSCQNFQNSVKINLILYIFREYKNM